MKKKWLFIMWLLVVRYGEAAESQSIQIPNQKYALYDVPPGGNDLVLNVVKGQGVNKILNDGIRLQDGSDNTQWAKDQAESQSADHPVYKIFGVNCGAESVCVTGLYSSVGNGGGGSGTLPSFDVDVLKMDLIIYVDQPVPGQDEAIVLDFPNYNIGHAWYELRITDVEDRLVADQFLGLLINQANFAVLNKSMGWYPKISAPTAPGKFVIPDTAHTPNIVMSYHLSSTHLIAGLAYSQGMRSSTTWWGLMTYNCTDVTLGVGSAVGLNLPDPTYMLPSWLGGGAFSSPGRFGYALQNPP